MAQAQRGDSVKVHYTGTLADGSVFDSSEGQEPLQFTIGAGEVIPGFDNGVLGMAPGEKKTVTIPAVEAYGLVRDDLTVKVPRSEFPPEIVPEQGMELEMHLPDGQPIPVMVCEVTDDTVTIDANHPLAGQDLTFALELVSIG